jgi:enoyl-CoA hydratase/carnithine racemase
LGISPGSVNRIAKLNGLEYSAVPKPANEARRDYAQAERLKLVNEFFDKTRALLPEVDEPQKLQHLATTLAILIDKRRLEDGEATSRAEVNSTDARDRIAGRITELTTRRRAEGVA